MVLLVLRLHFSVVILCLGTGLVNMGRVHHRLAFRWKNLDTNGYVDGYTISRPSCKANILKLSLLAKYIDSNFIEVP